VPEMSQSPNFSMRFVLNGMSKLISGMGFGNITLWMLRRQQFCCGDVCKEAQTLPEAQAKEVLNFVEFLKGKHNKTTAFETNNGDVLLGFGMWADREEMSRRDVFAELSSALVEAKAHSEGKLMLKTHQVGEMKG